MFSGSFTLRRLCTLVTTLGVAFALLSLAPVASQADHANPPGPVNAGTTYSWGKGDWMQHWEGRSGHDEVDDWKVRGRGLVSSRYGMMTLRPWSNSSLSATLKTEAWRTGRWEIRLRARRFDNYQDRPSYRVKTELVPAYAKYRCGARNIALQKFRLPGSRAKVYARNVPDRMWTASKRMNLRNDVWHTFGVEVTKQKITWYIDAHPYKTVKRDAALHGKYLTVRFKMQKPKGAPKADPSWMQMDWIRYFDMGRGGSPEGSRTKRGTYPRAC